MDIPHPTPTQTPTLFCGDPYFSGYENQLDGKVWGDFYSEFEFFSPQINVIKC